MSDAVRVAPALDAADEAALAALLHDGRHAEAAARLETAGAWLRAAEVHARVWQHAEAARCATQAGRLDEAYRHALAGEDRTALERLRVALLAEPAQARVAAGHAASRGRPLDAAQLREGAGELEEAASLYEQAGALREAARLRASLGALREAGRLYERVLADAPDDGEAALALGTILARFGRHEPAARVLQRAASVPEVRAPALRLLVACLEALGHTHGAASALDTLRAADPTLPPTVAAYLEAAFGDARGLGAIARETAAQAGPDVTRWLAGRYRVVRPLGAGGTGRVFLAHDAFHDREVAIKVLHVADGAQGRDAFARFAREARLAAAIDHPNVVRVFEFDPEGPFLVMEAMRGGTLEARLGAGRRLSPDAVRAVLEGLLAGLAAVHGRGVVHRDLKPANVFFDAAGAVKVGDFGVAHLADLGATLTGAMLGTLATMAPEQIVGGQAPTAATDLYAVGVLLVQMLTGALPLPGPDFVHQHLEVAPALPSALCPALGGTYDALAAALLAKDPSARPQSCDAVGTAIAALPWPALAIPEPMLEAQSAHPAGPDAASVDAPDAAQGRYVPVSDTSRAPSPDAAWTLARDLVLDRLVWLCPLDAAALPGWRACAAADHPHLQAVFDLDLDAGHAVLDAPAGAPPAPAARLDAAQAAQLAAALASLHAAGVAHGRVDRAHVRLEAARCVLLLPAARDPAARAADDLAALRAFGA
jgi:serine/threonine-protein kinase